MLFPQGEYPLRMSIGKPDSTFQQVLVACVTENRVRGGDDGWFLWKKKQAPGRCLGILLNIEF